MTNHARRLEKAAKLWFKPAGVAIAALLGLAALSGVGGFAGDGQGLNVVIITIDTLRPDRLSAYGYNRPTSPNIDRLAGEGVLFERAYSQIPATLPSHAAVFTGRFPASLRCTENWIPLPQSALTLAEILGERDYDTAAFVSAAVLDHEFDIQQGFKTFSDNLDVPLSEQALLELPYPGLSRVQDVVRAESEISARATVSRAISWLETKRREPFFLWVHLYSPHSPYVPPEEHQRKFETDKDDVLGRLNALYDGEVAYADAECGRLLKELRRLGDHTVVCFLGDHGEGLGHKDYLLHVQYLYEPELRIPLIVTGPGLPKGKRIPGLVQTVDLLPTLMELLQTPAPQGVQGKSLLPLMRGETSKGDDSVSGQRSIQLPPLGRLLMSGRAVLIPTEQTFIISDGPGPNKLIRSPDGSVELFDLSADPGEAQNLAGDAASGQSLAALTSRLERVERQWAAQMAPEEPVKHISPEVEERLRSLGYFR